RQILHAENRLGNLFVTRSRRINVKGRDDLKSFLLEAAVGEQGQTEVADTDENDRLQARSAEFVGDHLRQFAHVVAQSPRAERAEIREVLAQLGGLDPGDFRERFAGNGLEVFLLDPRQTAEIE